MGEERGWRAMARGKEVIFVRSWSFTCAGHVWRQARPDEKWERGGGSGNKRGRTRDSTDEKISYFGGKEESYALIDEDAIVVNVQRKCLFSKARRMTTRDNKEQPTRQRYQANARERDRTHRWRANYIYGFTFSLSSARETSRNMTLRDIRMKAAFARGDN